MGVIPFFIPIFAHQIGVDALLKGRFTNYKEKKTII